jgi:hypothetical protein
MGIVVQLGFITVSASARGLVEYPWKNPSAPLRGSNKTIPHKHLLRLQIRDEREPIKALLWRRANSCIDETRLIPLP